MRLSTHLLPVWPALDSKVKPWSQGWLIASRAYPGFCSMKRLEVSLLPLDGMLVHRRSLPRNFVRFFPTNSRYPFIHLGGERHCESKVSCPRTQHTVPGQGSNPERSIPARCHMWVEFVVGSRLVPRVFLRYSSIHNNQHSKFQFNQDIHVGPA